MTARLKKFLNYTSYIHPNQAGYQKGKTSMDWLFILRECIFFHINLKLPLYICFFDVRKAFDHVWTDGLFSILSGIGIRGKFLRLLWLMYKNSYSSVLVNGLLTRFFRLFVGVKQGACSSPDLYVIFVNQLAIKLEKMNIGLSIYGIWLGLLLFCDDMVIMANSREEMEKMIQIIKDH
jgi:hypothetical protein